MREITAFSNPLVKRVRSLRDKKHRRDEGLFLAFFKGLDPEDLRLRFFGPVREFSHAFLARLTQLDYARAIAFVATEIEPGGGERMLGAVRLHADANHESGEYAIAVGRDARGTGLAFALMRLMIELLLVRYNQASETEFRCFPEPFQDVFVVGLLARGHFPPLQFESTG